METASTPLKLTRANLFPGCRTILYADCLLHTTEPMVYSRPLDVATVLFHPEKGLCLVTRTDANLEAALKMTNNADLLEEFPLGHILKMWKSQVKGKLKMVGNKSASDPKITRALDSGHAGSHLLKNHPLPAPWQWSRVYSYTCPISEDPRQTLATLTNRHWLAPLLDVEYSF